MIYRIAICDDCREDRDRLKRLLLEFQDDTMNFKITEYRSGEDLLNEKDIMFHVIFLDYQMKKITGQETANQIRERDQQVILAFYTGVVEPTADSFRVQVYRYLKKNMEDEGLLADIKDIFAYMVEKNYRTTVWAQVGSINVSIGLDDILYIEKYKRGWSRIYTVRSYIEKINIQQDKKEVEFVYPIPLEYVYEKISNYGFEYAHSSYIVNFKHVVKYSRNELLLKEDIPLALTRSKLMVFRQRMREYLLKNGL